ncbi:kinase-like domain-containing protein [Rhizophagus clarus]|uniref:Kinase-like domain-containing protein n=1 Tax=Rhizophagus clarus TaxID=94130 RepID=A0A8H3R3W5_9GLOM|nr:kinase-like domain-containing protein [Rhizophagus clarus]
MTMMMSKFGNSENAIMDKFIYEKCLKWIPYNKFKNVEYLDKGGFGTIYKATWLDKDKEVVFKCIDDLNENLDKFLDEWKYHKSCLNSYDIIKLHGFTKNPNTLNYMAVMDYANKGNLRGNLTKIIENSWKQKLYMLYKIISGLYEIHKQSLVHCDLHDGNILYHKCERENEESEKIKEIKNNEEDKVYITDLGLCQPVKSYLKQGEIYGVVPFMAPEILRAHDIQLSLNVCKGERPKIIENTPQCYVDLMKKCWNENPSERPSASEVKNIIENWIFYPYNQINEELKSNVMEFINAPIKSNNFITEFHSQACYISRLLDFTSENLNEAIQSKCLDNCIDDIKSLDIKTDENL